MPKPDYDTTVARIAGNILTGQVWLTMQQHELAVRNAVALARAIVAEVRLTELPPPTDK